ncbi:MAG: MFS transporter [Planctomycetaceae bacterium]
MTRPSDANGDATGPGGRIGPPRPGTAVAWTLLDWAASAFSTVQITLLVAYADRFVFADRAWGVEAGVVWAWMLAAAMLVSALVAPWLAARADRLHGHRRALVASVVAGSAALATLAALPESARLAVAACIVTAVVAFDMAAIFTGSLLARIAEGPRADRLSAAGFAAGYLGGAFALVAATAIVQSHDALGLTVAGGLRAAFLFTGAWWLAFSLPAACARFGDGAGEHHAGTSARELLDFARGLAGGSAGRGVAATLAGAALVLGAVQTAIAQFSNVALAEFHLDGPALVRLVLLVQFVALPGALAVGWLSSRAGRHAAIGLCLAGWVSVLVLAWFVRSVPQLHALAVLLALVLGGAQSVIRATVADSAPPGRSGATFGLVHVGTKLAGCLASLAFGAIYALAGSPRAALAALLVQILAGWWVLRRAQGVSR